MTSPGGGGDAGRLFTAVHNTMPTVPRPKNHLDSFRYAVEGIVHVFRTQRHMRFHFLTLILVLLIGILYKLDGTRAGDPIRGGLRACWWRRC